MQAICKQLLIVAPLAGAWIETLDGELVITAGGTSHPLRVRGLKHAVVVLYHVAVGRTPCGCVD